MDSLSAPAHTDSSSRYRGRVVFLYAFDIAYDMRRHTIQTLLNQPVQAYAPAQDKRTPREVFFHQPRVVRLPSAKWETPWGQTSVERTIKIFAVGALSVALYMPFEVRDLGELVVMHEFRAAQEEATRLAEQVVRELQPWLIRPTAALRDEEAYIVFCLDWPPARDGESHASTEDWLRQHQRNVTALLVQETNAAGLSDQEIQETVKLHLSYYAHDLAVLDWDAAFLIDRPDQFGATLHTIELANVQLAELAAYDGMLDATLQNAYNHLRGIRARPGRTIKTLRELRIDMARLYDELYNTTKFFGDWHLARVYQALSQRFHLDNWQQIVNGKLRALAPIRFS